MLIITGCQQMRNFAVNNTGRIFELQQNDYQCSPYRAVYSLS